MIKVKFKNYGKLNKQVSTLGFGAWQLGYVQSDEEGVRLVKEAYDSGITFFDTAPNYGLGRSEKLIGSALSSVRENVTINSKFGHHVDDRIDFDVSLLRPSIKGSLNRLNTTYLDSVILHNPGWDILLGKTKHFEVLKQLKEEGLIKAYGVSIDTLEELRAVLNTLEVDVIELMFNIFEQSTREHFKYIKERNIALIIKVPLDSGWLSGKYNPETQFKDIRSRWTDEDKKRRSELVNALKGIVDEKTPLTHYALGYIWSYEAVTTVIPGIRSHIHLADHIASWKYSFDTQLREKFEAFYDKHIKDNPLPW